MVGAVLERSLGSVATAAPVAMLERGVDGATTAATVAA
jgi:hypothetical protein